MNENAHIIMLWNCIFEELDFGSVIIPAFFFRKKGYINFVPKSVRHILVNVSPPKQLDIAE